MEEYGDFAKQLEDEIMTNTSNFEEKKVGASFAERTDKIQRNFDKEVNIMEHSESRSHGLVEAEYSDTTECSSSFGGSDSGDEDVDNLGESEVLSGFRCGNKSALDFDGSGQIFAERKKLSSDSSHWRSFIHHLMWRCKWAELNIKKLDAQARKYDRKLQGYSQKNLVQYEKSTLEGHGLPFSQNNSRSDVLRRKKRRRAEATDALAAYMSQHNLFSYHEHWKQIDEISQTVLMNPDAPKKVNNYAELDNEELLSAETGSCDKFLEDALRKIDLLHSRVLKLKTRVDKVMSDHDIKPSSADTLSPTKASTSSPPTMYRMPVETYIVSQLMSEYNFGGLLLPESAVPSNGEVATDANGSRNNGHLAPAYENDGEDEDDDEILIDNQRVRDELRYFEEVQIHSFQSPCVIKEASIPQAPKSTNDQPRLRDRSSNSNPTNIPESSRKSRRIR